MALPRQNLLLLFGSIIISFLLSVSFFKVTAAQSEVNLVVPSSGSSTTSNLLTIGPDDPPGLALKGKIASPAGEIFWQSRTATEAAKVTLPAQIQQGEHLQTGDNGSVSVQFPGVSTLSLLPKSAINFAQTLPLNLVYVQTAGLVEYGKFDQTPVSIRALHLLIDQGVGDILVAVDNDTDTVTINVKKGSVTLAFNDADELSTVLTMNSPRKYTFNDDKRTGVIRLLR